MVESEVRKVVGKFLENANPVVNKVATARISSVKKKTEINGAEVWTVVYLLDFFDGRSPGHGVIHLNDSDGSISEFDTL